MLSREGGGRTAVIDIGSNSIRLVVFERLARVLATIFNEKVLCGLANGLDTTGRLSPDGVVLALGNLMRFSALLEAMAVEDVTVLATSAVRDASDGPAFVAEVKARAGLDIRIISGEEEAILAGKGVISGIPDALGVVGDLGGGSLELIGIGGGEVGQNATLPLGPLRLQYYNDLALPVRLYVRRLLHGQTWLFEQRGRSLYPVGGAWRSLAKAHMSRTNYPLRIIHQLVVGARDLQSTARLLSGQSVVALQKMRGVSRRRLDTMPLAAMVMDELIEMLAPERIVFSSYGVREGFLFSRLDPQEAARDPLVAGCEDIAFRLGRFGDTAAVGSWIRPLFADEPPARMRLLEASALLSDLCWDEHPDYRAILGFQRVLVIAVGGLDHHERLILALAMYVRYGGDPADEAVAGQIVLLDEADRSFAGQLGQALRLGHTVTGGAPDRLGDTFVRRNDGYIEVHLPNGAAALAGEVLGRRVTSVARTMGLEGRVVTPADDRPAAVGA